MFAVRANEIVEAVDAGGITPLPHIPAGMSGCLTYNNEPLPVFDRWRVLAHGSADGADGLAPAQRMPTHVVIMRSAAGRFGLLVDGLGEIVDVNEDRVRFLPTMVAARESFADAAVAQDDDSSPLVVMLRAEQLYANLAAAAPAMRAA